MPEPSIPDGSAQRSRPTEPAAETTVSIGPAETIDTATDTVDAAGTVISTVPEEPSSTAGTTVLVPGHTPVIEIQRSDTADSIAADPSAGDPLPGRGARRPGSSGVPTRPVAPPAWQHIAYPAGVLSAAGITGLVAAATIPVDRPGIGWLLAGAAAAGAVIVVHRRSNRSTHPKDTSPRFDRERSCWALAALALLSVGTFRAAGWLFVLCVGAAAVAGSLAVVGSRSTRGMLRDAAAVPLASVSALAWVYSGQTGLRNGAGSRRGRLGGSVAVTLGLLAVFVPLLAGADATFAALVEALVPRMDGGTVARWTTVFLLAGIGSASAAYLLAGGTIGADHRSSRPRRTLTGWEWGLPVGALTAVFAVFVGAQLVALFGGDAYVQRTAGLTYAEYARSGFWQLSTVTVLTLAVLLVVLHRADRDSAADRRWLRGLLCGVCALTLVMVASALGRMWTYQEAYGFTVLRVLVGTCELWLGVVYILVIVAVLRLESAWLPRATAASAVAALLTLSVLNPEGLVAQQNIDRWQRGEELDIGYLAGLSADIVPAVDRLPATLRIDLRAQLRLGLGGDSWNSWNLARARAR